MIAWLLAKIKVGILNKSYVPIYINKERDLQFFMSLMKAIVREIK